MMDDEKREAEGLEGFLAPRCKGCWRRGEKDAGTGEQSVLVLGSKVCWCCGAKYAKYAKV